MKTMLWAAVLAAVFTAGAAQAGTITGVAGGTAAPAATLGPYTMTPFDLDPRPRGFGELVIDVPSPLGGDLMFDDVRNHYRVGDGWLSWSHSYTGDVYHDSPTTLILTLPADTYAFYFYAQPNQFVLQQFTATAQDGTQILQSAHGTGGAAYFGFWADGMTLDTITISSTNDFGIGEFGIAGARATTVPLPGAAVAAVPLLFAVAGLRRFRRR